jgi:hypothetical protein
MSYEVRLKIRLENLKSQSIPKRCSSCYAKPARHRRVLTTQYQARKMQRIQWNIQLPLCDTCQGLAEVLADYRPSKHGPPERATGNRNAALALLIVSVVAIVSLFLPNNLFISTLGISKGIAFFLLAALFGGIYYWNYQANQRGRVAAYQKMVDEIGHPFGDVTIEKGTFGPVLTFDNDEYGQAFAEANSEFVLDEVIPEEELDKYLADRETRAEKIMRFLLTAFRIR